MGLYRAYIGLGNQAIQLPFECTTDLPYYIPLITHDVKKLRLPCFEPETTLLSFSFAENKKENKENKGGTNDDLLLHLPVRTYESR